MVLPGSKSSSSDIQEKPDNGDRCGLNDSTNEVEFSTAFMENNSVLACINDHLWRDVFSHSPGIIISKKIRYHSVKAVILLLTERMLSRLDQTWTQLMERIHSVP